MYGREVEAAATRLADYPDTVGAQLGAQREPEITAEYRRLQDAIECAMKAAGALIDRIGPVSRIEPESTNKASAPQPAPPCSQFASQLRGANDAVEHLTGLLNGARNRLEI